MNLDAAITYAQIAIDTQKVGSRCDVQTAALVALLDHARATSLERLQAAANGPRRYKPNAHTIRRLLERLDANSSWGAEQLRDFDWDHDAPAPDPVVSPAPTLRDTLAMHAPEPGAMPSSFYPDGMRPEQRTSAIGMNDVDYAEHSARNRAAHTAACYAWADAMLAVRGRA